MSINVENKHLTNVEEDTIGEVLNISMGAAATAISIILNRQVTITTPVVSQIKKEKFEYKSLEPAIGAEINYTKGLHGSNLMIMSVADVKAIVSILLGETYVESSELDEIHTSALGEIMNQMMGSASTALATFFNKGVEISAPKIVNPHEFYDDFFSKSEDNIIITVSFKFVVEDLFDSQFITVLPLEFAKEIVNNAMNLSESQVVEQSNEYKDNVTGHKQINSPIFADETTPTPKTTPKPQKTEPDNKPKKNISVQNIQFEHFDDDGVENETPEQVNLDLVMGVEVTVTVEIGHAKKLVKDVLNISKGSIIELDKQAGDPVDVIVNGQLIAKGDVVVIDDNFGIRITKVLNSKG